MAERSLRTLDVPTFDTYPGPECPRTDMEHQLPPRIAREAENPRWNETAENIGRTAGRVIAMVRELPNRMEEARDEMKERLRVIRSQAGASGQNQIVEFKRAAECKFEELKSRARERILVARSRAQRMVHQRPLEFIGGAFAAAFVLGVAVRIWRSNRA